MLGKIFDVLCPITTFVGLIALTVSPLDESVLASICLAIFILLVLIALVVFIIEDSITITGVKGIDNEVTIFVKEYTIFGPVVSARSSDVGVTMLSPNSKREIENLLKKRDELEEKNSVIPKLIIPSVLAIVSALFYTFYLIPIADVPPGPLAITTAFVLPFSVFYCFVQLVLIVVADSHDKAIGRIVIRDQRFHDGNGSVEIIKPFIFNCGYDGVEGYPLKWGTRTGRFHSFLDGCLSAWKRPKVNKILKEFVLLHNSNMSSVKKAETKFKLMRELDEI